MIQTGNLFILAEKQLIKEVENGKRKTYKLSDIIDYGIKIRRFLDKKGGNIEGILNQLDHTPQELRRQKYIRTGK